MLGGEFGSCSLIIGILQSLISNAFLTALAHHISGVTLHASPTLDTNVWGYYNKLVAFIPIAKDV
ncbi:hypothetical protein HpNP70_11680 [Helicobacter pylori]